MSQANPKLETFLKEEARWKSEIAELRRIASSCALTEEIKWGKPCYTAHGGNIVIIIPLKETVAFSFCKGALLKDPKRILAAPGENSQSGMWVKFTSTAEILKQEKALKAYIAEAIEAQASGKEITFKKTSDYPVPDELRATFKSDPKFKAAWDRLTPGRQRGWLIFFGAAKQSATREARIEKASDLIFAGKGMHDGYRDQAKP